MSRMGLQKPPADSVSSYQHRLQRGKRQPAHITQTQIQACCKDFCNSLCCVEVLDEWYPEWDSMEELTWPEELRLWPITAMSNPRGVAKALRECYPEDCKLMVAAHWLEDRLRENSDV